MPEPTPEAGAGPQRPPEPGGPEYREGPFGDVVIVAAARSRRPHDSRRHGAPGTGPVAPGAVHHDPDCPFCAGNEDRTPPEVAAIRPEGSAPDTPGWLARVVPNLYPALGPGAPGPPWTDEATARRRPAHGVHEVLVHSPDHAGRLCTLPPGALAEALQMWQERIRTHRAAGWAALAVVVNEGREAGASLAHPHAQLFAADVVPPALAAEQHAAKDRPVVAELAAAEARGPRAVDAEGALVAWCPWASTTPYEVWLAPALPGAAPAFPEETRLPEVAALLGRVARRIAAAAGDPALNVVLRDDAPWHLRVLPRTSVPAGFEAATGVRILALAPEDAAATLRDPRA